MQSSDTTYKKVGIDIGSRYVKILISNNNLNRHDNEIIDTKIIDTIDFYKNYTFYEDNNLNIDMIKLLGDEKFHITATGYGRNLLSFNNANIISEIKAHFRGAKKSSSLSDFTLIDIGGQDSKVILSRNGYIEDFIMNDKCAASTGRFLENTAAILGITIDDLSSMHSTPIAISVTCAVFAESEIIGQLALGKKIDEIGAGINLSIAKRLATLISPKLSDNILASGGVAKNRALISFLSELIKREICILPNSEFNGAFGAISY